MTNDNQTNDTSKKPTHIAYHVKKNGEQSYWNPIGAVWTHKDGKGFSVKLDTIPLDGKIEIREPKLKDQVDEA